jgi:hypothetical protein
MAALSIVLVAASGAQAAEDGATTPTGVATAVEGIRVDGVLDDGEWSRATPIGPLVQRDPVEGAVASETTEVRVAFDRDNLYFGITCGDRTPSGIVATQLGRDADLDADDWVVIVLDPFFDQRNGFFFFVNPAGARTDGQISNNAREPSFDWDGIWDARARITQEGWVAEIVIPFKTLRFKPGQAVGPQRRADRSRFQEHDRCRLETTLGHELAADAGGPRAGWLGTDIRPYARRRVRATGRLAGSTSSRASPRT